ncbi:hypothetical protein [Streptomyces sp. NPDC096032]|uniref:hypothetical protein n=1 Tax=Streptomyces sp. NPDC096032 TaxID=3366070 RepID=UPI0038157E66
MAMNRRYQLPPSYPSDLSDARWELIRPTLEAWRQARNGIRPTHELRGRSLRGSPDDVARVCTALLLEYAIAPWAGDLHLVATGFADDLLHVPLTTDCPRRARQPRPGHGGRVTSSRGSSCRAGHLPRTGRLVCASVGQ